METWLLSVFCRIEIEPAVAVVSTSNNNENKQASKWPKTGHLSQSGISVRIAVEIGHFQVGRIGQTNELQQTYLILLAKLEREMNYGNE